MSKLSVIIPHYNDLARLDTGLTALTKSLAGIDHEIIVVDNGSKLAEADIRRVTGDRAQLLFCLEQGAGPARNMGVAASSGDILAFIDSDCVASENWARAGLADLAHANVVGGHVSIFAVDPEHYSGAEAYEAVFGFNIKAYVEKKGFVGSGNMFVQREDFDRVGGFRKAVSEDVDWSHRASAAGLKLIYSRNAEVGHPARKDWGELKRKFERVQNEQYHLARTKKHGRAKWLVRNLVMPFSIVPHATKVTGSSAIPDAASKLRGLATLLRLRLWRSMDGFRLLLTDGKSNA